MTLTGRQNKLAMAGSVVAPVILAASLFLRDRLPQNEPLQKATAGIAVAFTSVSSQVFLPPVNDDKKCEVEKGEADYLSKVFSPTDCGFCGDGIRQKTANTWSKPQLDPDPNNQDSRYAQIMIQYVTSRPDETPESCPVDFHECNGRIEKNAQFGTIVQDNTVYSLQTTKVDESCAGAKKSCDCKSLNKHSGPVVKTKADVGDEPLPTGPCELSTTSPGQSSKASDVISTLMSGISSNAATIRSILGSPNVPVSITLSMHVSADGSIQLTGSRASCDGQTCSITPPQLTFLGVGVKSFAPPKVPCFWSYTASVPQ